MTVILFQFLHVWLCFFELAMELKSQRCNFMYFLTWLLCYDSRCILHGSL